MAKEYGAKRWFFPDGDRPPVHRQENGADETIVIVNTSDKPAHIRMTVYYTNRDPGPDIPLTVPAERVKCFSTRRLAEEGLLDTEIHEQYAFVLESDVAVAAQYIKLSDDDQPMHVYGMMGFGL